MLSILINGHQILIMHYNINAYKFLRCLLCPVWLCLLCPQCLLCPVCLQCLLCPVCLQCLQCAYSARCVCCAARYDILSCCIFPDILSCCYSCSLIVPFSRLWPHLGGWPSVSCDVTALEGSHRKTVSEGSPQETASENSPRGGFSTRGDSTEGLFSGEGDGDGALTIFHSYHWST